MAFNFDFEQLTFVNKRRMHQCNAYSNIYKLIYKSKLINRYIRVNKLLNKYNTLLIQTIEAHLQF